MDKSENTKTSLYGDEIRTKYVMKVRTYPHEAGYYMYNSSLRERW